MVEPIDAQQHVNLSELKAVGLSDVHSVEVTDEKSKLEPGEEWVHNRTRIEENQVIIEQYDESGRLLKITPPGYLLFGEIA